MFNFRASSIVFILTGFTMLVWFGEVAFGQGMCGINIAKVAAEGGDTEFPIETTVDNGEPNISNLIVGVGIIGDFSSSFTATELPLDGWALADIKCEGNGATSFDITDNGFTATCDGGGNIECTFTNVSAVSNIPTLSEWGMIAAAAGLGLVGIYFIIRRKRAVA